VNNSDSVVNCVSTTPSSLSSTTSPVQVDSNTALSSLKSIAQKAIDQAGIDISQQSTDTKSNYTFLKVMYDLIITKTPPNTFYTFNSITDRTKLT